MFCGSGRRGEEQREFSPLRKMACHYPGNPLKGREFSRGMGTSSCKFGDMELINSAHLTLRSGLHFVVANKCFLHRKGLCYLKTIQNSDDVSLSNLT